MICYVCALHAVTRGVDYTPGSAELADGTELHEAVTSVGGTAVCWFHVAHVNDDGTLSDDGRHALAMEQRA